MSRSLAWKEMRELLLLSAVFLALNVLSLSLVFTGSWSTVGLGDYVDTQGGPLWKFWMFAAGCIGLLQSINEASRDRLTLIRHRPLSAVSIYVTKWWVGATLVSVSYLIPLGLLTLCLIMPGISPRPFWWPDLLIAVGQLIPILVCHLAGLLLGQHGPRWIMSR